jgi:HEAT repeat protein
MALQNQHRPTGEELIFEQIRDRCPAIRNPMIGTRPLTCARCAREVHDVSALRIHIEGRRDTLPLSRTRLYRIIHCAASELNITRPLMLLLLLILSVAFLPASGGVGLAASPRLNDAGSQQEALAAFKKGHFDQVVRVLETLPPGQEPSRELLQLGVRSYLKIGRPETAFKHYVRLVPVGQPDDRRLLHEIATAFIANHVRGPEEYVRIAAYTALKGVADPQMMPVLEDGLFDSSALVRALAAEGLGRALVASKSSKPSSALTALKRALQDPAPAVRIAAINALGDAGDQSVTDVLRRMVRADEGALAVFAAAALVKLGHDEAFDDILSTATLPDPNARMAAIGILGRLKRPRAFTVLSQSIYDPDPTVRAFAAGALGEFGTPESAAPLTHAIGDEDPRVRGIAAASLGRLQLPHTRPLLWQAAKDPVDFVRAGAVEGLLRIGDGEASLVARELSKQADPSVRSAVAQAIGQSRYKQGIPLLDFLRQDLQPQPRLMAARALGKMPHRQALPILRPMLQDSDTAVRVTAAGSVLQTLRPAK